ncbi:TPA: his operon leader peptide, partial [Klebsiella pneumoniae]|nr:his operon leader peptide [Klebsiella pneumoniae]
MNRVQFKHHHHHH